MLQTIKVKASETGSRQSEVYSLYGIWIWMRVRNPLIA